MFPALVLIAIATCKVDNAVYRQRFARSITAKFHAVDSGAEWPSGLALEMRFGSGGRTYWWLPWDGGTDGQQHLASTSDITLPGWQAPSPDNARARPLGDVSFIATDASYRVLRAVPRRGAPAPAHFLVPDLRQALWYRTPPGERDADARQFFDLISC